MTYPKYWQRWKNMCTSHLQGRFRYPLSQCRFLFLWWTGMRFIPWYSRILQERKMRIHIKWSARESLFSETKEEKSIVGASISGSYGSNFCSICSFLLVAGIIHLYLDQKMSTTNSHGYDDDYEFDEHRQDNHNFI